MFTLWHRAAGAPEPGVVLTKLDGKIGEEYRRQSGSLWTVAAAPDQVDALTAAIRCTSETHAAIRRMRAQPACSAATAHAQLRELADAIREALNHAQWPHYAALQALSSTLSLVVEAGKALDAGQYPVDNAPTGHPAQVIVSSDLLYQAHQSLFPAERMLAAAGRRAGPVVHLGAVFEVTGEANGGHVRCDPTRMARALISMSASDTYFAGWLHSHPGRGADATGPSSTDTAQYQDLIKDYSDSLVGCIVVLDGWIRFWGAAVEQSRIRVSIDGPGVKEVQDGRLYHLEQ